MAALHKALLIDEVERMEEIRAFIKLNLKADLNLNKLGGKFGCSRSTLERHFIMTFNQSVHHYIFQCRMIKAMDLLISHRIPITQIGLEVGYKDRTGFTRAFAKYFGNPPLFYLLENTTSTVILVE